MASSARSLNRSGNSFYKKGKYVEALTKYEQAQAIDPKNMLFDYNIGCASYKSDSLAAAASSFLKAISSMEREDTKEKAYYNFGNALFKGGKLDGAIESYKQALRLNPQDIDAKINLELAQKIKEEKQKEKKNDQNQNKKEKGEKNKKKQNKKEGEKNREKAKNEKKEEQNQKLSKEEAKNLLKAVEEEEKKAKKNAQKTRGGKVRVLKDW